MFPKFYSYSVSQIYRNDCACWQRWKFKKPNCCFFWRKILKKRHSQHQSPTGRKMTSKKPPLQEAAFGKSPGDSGELRQGAGKWWVDTAVWVSPGSRVHTHRASSPSTRAGARAATVGTTPCFPGSNVTLFAGLIVHARLPFQQNHKQSKGRHSFVHPTVSHWA